MKVKVASAYDSLDGFKMSLQNIVCSEINELKDCMSESQW